MQEFADFSCIEGVLSVHAKTKLISFEKNLQNEAMAVFWFVTELLKITFNIEFILFHRFIKTIEQEKNAIEKMFVTIGRIDTAISCASIEQGDLTTCIPEFSTDKNLKVENIYHPLIENCVANNLNIEEGSLLLTGSNMSGKTTFIRTIGINAVLAQTLNFCFASSYKAPFFKVHSSIRIADNVLESKSYYFQEVLRIKKLIDASESSDPCLLILDELFKGTNTIERISAGNGVLSYLNKGNNLVLVSTHDIELTELLNQEAYVLYHFSETIQQGKLHFDYQIKPGKLKTRNAIKILELNDFASEIISKARKTETNLMQLN